MKKSLTIGLTALLLALPLISIAAGAATSDRSVFFATLSSLEAKVLILQQQIADLRAQLTASIASTTVAQVPTPLSLTSKLLLANKQYRSATTNSSRAALLSDLTLAAESRKKEFLSLMAAHPAAALTHSLPEKLKADLPDSIQALIETEITLEGTFEHLHGDDFAHGTAQEFFTLTSAANERVTIHFSGKAPQISSGSKVRVRGMKLDTTMVAETTNVAYMNPNNTTTTTTASAPIVLSNTTGAQNTAVFLINYANNPTYQPITPAAAQALFFGTGNRSVTNYFKEASYGQTWLTGTVFGWYTSSQASTTCNIGKLQDDAKAAATAAGANLSQYTRYVFIAPANSVCWFGGFSTVGGNPAQSFINGVSTLVIAHEMGHGFGLYHSHGLECGATTIGDNCTSYEYGDPVDTMGNVQMSADSAAHYNAFQKSLLGWIPTRTTTVTTSGTYMMNPYETQATDSKVLKILKSTNSITGVKSWYYVERRQAIGFDDFLPAFYVASSSYLNTPDGVVLGTGVDDNADSSQRLDATASSSPWYEWNDLALAVGKTHTDGVAGVSITTLATSTTGATVSVALGAPSCGHEKPVISMSPTSGYGTPGQTVSYTITVGNADSLQCAPATFTVTSSFDAGSGLSQSPASFTMTLAPGASGSQVVGVTSPTSAPLFTGYNIFENVTNGANPSLSASTNVIYWVWQSTTDTTAPTTVITSPLMNASVPHGAVTTIAASASDNVGVTKVTFFVNSKLVCTDTVAPYTCAWTVPNAPKKTYTLQSKAYDAAGNIGMSSLVTVKSL